MSYEQKIRELRRRPPKSMPMNATGYSTGYSLEDFEELAKENDRLYDKLIEMARVLDRVAEPPSGTSTELTSKLGVFIGPPREPKAEHVHMPGTEHGCCSCGWACRQLTKDFYECERQWKEHIRVATTQVPS